MFCRIFGPVFWGHWWHSKGTSTPNHADANTNFELRRSFVLAGHVYLIRIGGTNTKTVGKKMVGVLEINTNKTNMETAEQIQQMARDHVDWGHAWQPHDWSDQQKEIYNQEVEARKLENIRNAARAHAAYGWARSYGSHWGPWTAEQRAIYDEEYYQARELFGNEH